VWETLKPRSEFKEDRKKIQAIETHAVEIADSLNVFTFEEFERRLLGNTNKQLDVLYFYNKAFELYTRNNQIGTLENYKCSLKSLLEFSGTSTLHFKEVTVQWLKDYESFMIRQGKSLTTVGIYLRPLRAILNTAKLENVIDEDTYPFGKRKYVIPQPTAKKKALSNDQLGQLLKGIPSTKEQEKAKAFWFFSYACNGMNMKDIANLQYRNLSKETIVFKRAKTSNTSKSQSPVVVYRNEHIDMVIEQYGNSNPTPNGFVFPIIDQSLSYAAKHVQLKNFIRYVNQHFLNYAKSLGIEEKISSYWARHSFATMAIRKGASMEFVGEALSHSNIKTTQGYFAGFEDKDKKKFMQSIMSF